MNKRGKQVLVFSLVAIISVALISILAFNLIFADSPITLSVQTTTPSINEDTISMLNFTITEQNSTTPGTQNNITRIDILLPAGVLFVNISGLTASSYNASFFCNTSQYYFSNSSSTLNFTNTSVAPLIRNNTAGYLWFNVSVAEPGVYNLTFNISYQDAWNTTNVTITVSDISLPVAESINTTKYLGYASRNTENFSVFNTTSTLNFSCNMSDNVGLASVTLYITPTQFGPTFLNSTPEIGGKTYNTITGTYNQTNFTQTISESGTYNWYCRVGDTSNNLRSSSAYTITVNAFSFSGWVKNSTYNNVPGANVSIYEFVQSQSGPPTQRLLKSTTTGATGAFTLTDIQNNGSQATIYKIKVTLNNSAGLAIEVGPNLPQFPRDPLIHSMNNGTFYLQNATTIRLYAYNNITYNGTLGPGGAPSTLSNNVSAVNFGYEVIDQALGFPIESNVQGEYATADVVVPANRNYTIMFVRDPMSFSQTNTLCQGPGKMNQTDCPSPPASVSITSENIINLQNSSTWDGNVTAINSTQYMITINKSLAFSQYNLTGCINIAGNTTAVTLKDITSKMIPWEGFLPPIKAEISDFDATESDNFVQGAAGKGCTLGAFNLTLMGSASGINWFIEAYANDTNTTLANEYFAAFQNITMTNSDKIYNLTLVKLLGSYLGPSGDANTSKMEIAIMDSNGTAPQQVHVEVYVRNPVFGTMHYIIETLTGGKFNISLLSNTQEARVRVFSNQYAPKETKIKLYTTDVTGRNRTNVTLYAFRPMKFLDNGSVAPNKSSGNSITMRFMMYSDVCNVYTPATTCKIGDDKNADFDPLQAMMAGRSNLWMKTSSNITLYFINVDMMASGPPDAMMNDNASSSSSSTSLVEQVWKFGSMAPDVYEKVLIGIPYNISVNENMTYNINLSVLYDNDNSVIWNVTANGSGTSQMPSDYSDFNVSWFSTGITCSNTTSASVTSGSCFMNTTDNRGEGNNGTFWITLPHFSTTTNKISGRVVTTTTASTPSSGGGGGGGGGATTYDLSAEEFISTTKNLGVGEIIKLKVENATHTVKLIGLTASSASVQVKSIVITKLLQVGQPAENVDVDQDNVNELSLLLNSVNLTTVKANITVKSLVYVPPAAITNVTVGCGNGITETGENCQNCPADVKCAANEECVDAVCKEKATTPTTIEEPQLNKTLIYCGIAILVIVTVIILLVKKLRKE